MAQTSVEPPGPLKEWREPTVEEVQVIQKWSERDGHFDAMILDVGNVVDRLANIAQDMNVKSVKQQEQACDITTQAEHAHADLSELNSRLKDFLYRGSSGGFMGIRITLIFLFLIESGWMFSLCYARMTAGRVA
eukprot:GHVH01001510.1.p1 GENE.GHVH01001510.1~~GHVH01001510.1.p1  ORF type:complete len:134 (-),score=24.99 GHVH01001510.1:100-501(-)